MTDLNLIRAFVAIYETGTVSAAAKRLNLTQPSVSHALSRLRNLLHDPLFTRGRQGMVPTFNATQLFHAFSDAIGSIEGAIAATRQFDPSKSTRRFRVAMSDLGEFYFLPFLVREFLTVAPYVGLEIVQLDSERISESLVTGSVDAAVGNLQFIGGRVRKRALFTETYSCLLSTSHCFIGETLSLQEYVAASHVVVTPFTGHRLVQDVLTEMGLTRTVALQVPHFTNIVNVVASTDLLLTLPTRVAKSFAMNGRMRVLPVPFPIPTFDVNLFWQPDTEDSAPQQWLCETIVKSLSGME
ncbi:LysR family transcriptional regulator [Paraburkholderia sp. BCC1884]|uniref:LysR family transcriptional regulator n=1 Tax=Paraburkholderia sp. BCC1884 TaxID=2562668 RepID=UPI0021B1BCCE|nr:LysR family transcriptional regulator [Paraburkholderia sp. BCC1884]